MLGLGMLVAGLFGFGSIVEGSTYDGPEGPWYVAIAILSVAVCFAGWFAVAAAGNYVANEDVSGKRVAWLTAATWLLWFLWGIPVSGAWLSAALVIYTALVLPPLLLVLLVSWLIRSGRSKLIALIPVVAAVLTVGFVAARPAQVLGNDGDALSYSVSRELGGDVGVDSCEKLPRGWLCSVLDSGGSTSRSLYVFLDSGGCWKAYPPKARERGREQGSACVSLRDYLRLWERLT
jgi:hypothetical protein